MKLSTTNKMEVIEGKTLKLNHVLIRRISAEEMADLQKISMMFQSFAKANNYTQYGPMILHSLIELKDGNPVQVMELMGQIREAPESVQAPYTFTEQIRIENCLFVRYHGSMAKLSIAYQKLGVYCYENDLSTNGETYTIFLESKMNNITADIFTEVIE